MINSSIPMGMEMGMRMVMEMVVGMMKMGIGKSMGD